MNLMRYRSVKIVGATLIGVAGMFAATIALAGSQRHGGDPELKNVHCDLDHKTLKVKGEVKNAGHKDLEVKVEVKGTLKVDCKNPGGIVVEAQSGKFQFKAHEVEEVDKWGDFKVPVYLAAELKEACPNENWKTLVDKIRIDKVTVKLFEDGDLVDTVKCEFDRWGNCDCDDGSHSH